MSSLDFAETLVKEFSGRQIDGHKIDAGRVARQSDTQLAHREPSSGLFYAGLTEGSACGP
jgi:hypothetical protein